MKIFVLGVERVSYISKKDNRPVDGVSVYFADIGKKSDSLDGYRTNKIWISRGLAFADFDWTVGETYSVYMDGYSVEEVIPIDYQVDIHF